VPFDTGKRYGAPVEWQQDWAFYPHTNDDLAALGIMLDDCGIENGPMMVIPGSHQGRYDHHGAGGRFCGTINPARCGLDFLAGGAVPRQRLVRSQCITCAPSTAQRPIFRARSAGPGLGWT
jgi:hypothetical protein